MYTQYSRRDSAVNVQHGVVCKLPTLLRLISSSHSFITMIFIIMLFISINLIIFLLFLQIYFDIVRGIFNLITHFGWYHLFHMISKLYGAVQHVIWMCTGIDRQITMAKEPQNYHKSAQVRFTLYETI